MLDVKYTSDYKLDKNNKKVKAHRLVFNTGADDGKRVTEMKKTFNIFTDQHYVITEIENISLDESYHPNDYHATSEKSRFSNGHRAKLVHKEKGHTSYLGATAYKSKEHAEGEAKTFRDNYTAVHGRATPGASDTRADRAVSAYRKAAKENGYIAEGLWPGTIEYKKKFGDDAAAAGTVRRGNRHDITRTKNGEIAIRRFNADDEAETPKDTVKRGRGRPKKNKFSEAVDLLMSFNEEQFDSLMEEGFDSFFEMYDQLDELNKTTLKSYINKASNSAVSHGIEYSKRQAAGDEVDRFTNRHMTDKYSQNDKIKKAVGGDSNSIDAARAKAAKRISGIKTAVNKL